MSYVDIILIVLALGAAVIGYRRGAIRQAASIGGILVALFAVRMAGDKASAAVAGMIGQSPADYASRIIGCGLLFVAVWCWCCLLGRLCLLSGLDVWFGGGVVVAG